MSIPRSLLIFPFLLLGIVFLNSCEKEKHVLPTDPDVIPEKDFVASVDGVAFVDTILWAVENEAGNTITITATADGGYPQMVFNLPADISPGSYTLGGAQSTNQAILKFGSLVTEQFEALALSGSLNVSLHNTEEDYIKATFYFTAVAVAGNTSTQEFDVSGGDFTLSY